MGFAGVRRDGEQDFPYTLRESVTPLPFHKGGTTTLTAGEAVTLVYVKGLRRFENADAVVRGIHTGNDDALVLTDSNATFDDDGIDIGDELVNTSKNTTGTVTAITNTTLTTDGQEWDNTDTYVVNKRGPREYNRAVEIRKFSLITDEAIYLRYDGTPHGTDGFDVEIDSGEDYSEENIRIVGRLAAVGVDATTTPKVRWTVWGV